MIDNPKVVHEATRTTANLATCWLDLEVYLKIRWEENALLHHHLEFAGHNREERCSGSDTTIDKVYGEFNREFIKEVLFYLCFRSNQTKFYEMTIQRKQFTASIKVLWVSSLLRRLLKLHGS